MKPHRLTIFFTVVGLVFLFSYSGFSEQEPAFQGTALSNWLERIGRARTEQQYAQASNAIHEIGTNALPFLLQIVRTTNRPPEKSYPSPARLLNAPIPTDGLSLEVALACRVLGPRADPIFTELTNRLSSADWNVADMAMDILLNSGPPALQPLMEFYSSPERYSPVRVSAGFREGIDTLVRNNPRGTVPTIIAIYERGDSKMRAASIGILEDAFSDDLSTAKQEVELLFPFLRPSLESREPFIRTQILAYLRRCGPNARAAVSDVKKLLSDSDPMVRSEATNALAAIESLK